MDQHLKPHSDFRVHKFLQPALMGFIDLQNNHVSGGCPVTSNLELWGLGHLIKNELTPVQQEREFGLHCWY